MSVSERERAFQNAEKLLRAGKVSSAIEEFRVLADDAPRDVPMLNRIGDLLARAGRGREAIGYYERIADQFAAAGFYPKAVAIVKKAARLDPDRVEVVVRLGEFNLRQKKIGEAKAFLLRAGDLLVRSGQMERARQVFERLVAADPSDVLNRVRLAEARAAAGDTGRATEELVAAARQFASAGRIEDAERTFRRALAIAPAAVEPVAALAALLAASGRREEGASLLTKAVADRPGDAALRSEWFVFTEHAGGSEESLRFLRSEASNGLHPAAVERALTESIAHGGTEGLWSRLDALLNRWIDGRRFDRVTTLLDRLARVEPNEHVPALERLVAAREAEGNPPETARAVERLMRALQARGEVDRLTAFRDRLRDLGAASPDLPPVAPPRPAPAASAGRAARPEPEGPTTEPQLPVRFEAPAVPLSPADHEFVTGHLTEAEVFLKYSLPDEAANQLRAVVSRFPGHVEANERLVDLVGARSSAEARQSLFTDLAWARRAAGDESGARTAMEAAAALGPLPEAVRAASIRLGIAPVEPPVEDARATPQPERLPAPPRAEAPSTTPGTPRTAESDEEWVIDFEAEEAGSPSPPKPEPPAAPKSHVRVASEDMIEEIGALAEGGRAEEALRKIEALRLLGFGGADLDLLEETVRAAQAPSGGDRLDEEDLSALTAALASEAPEAEAEPAAAAGDDESEQSLEEVFDTFKRHVDATVQADDFRTRYDLGIAYKEMGLLDEALEAFHAAARSPELHRDACTMLALCHRERGEIDEAVDWYRRALESGEEGVQGLHGIRYDLAEVLLERGEAEHALSLFRSVLEFDPSYREVRRYVTELQSRVDR